MYSYNPIDAQRRIEELRRRQQVLNQQILNESKRLQTYRQIPPQTVIEHQLSYIQNLEKRLNLPADQTVREFQNECLNEVDDVNRTESLQQKMSDIQKRRSTTVSKPKDTSANNDSDLILEEYYLNEARQDREFLLKEYPGKYERRGINGFVEVNARKPLKKHRDLNEDKYETEFDRHIAQFESEPESIPRSNVSQLTIGDSSYDLSEIMDALAMYHGNEKGSCNL